MTQATAHRIHKIYGIVLTGIIILVGLCLMGCSLYIYLTGDQIYTPEKVSDCFSAIAVPVYLCLALIVGKFILNNMLPAETNDTKRSVPSYMELARITEKVDYNAVAPEIIRQVTQQRNLRKRNCIITMALLVVSFGIFLTYALNIANFPQGEYNSAVLRGALGMLICLLLPCFFAIFTVYRNQKSIETEIGFLKKAPRKLHHQEAEKSKTNYIPMVQGVLTVLALGLLVFGMAGNGAVDVLAKAIKICTECIGLG